MLYRQTYVVDGQTFVTVNDQQFNVVISPTEKSVILHPVINGEVDTTIVIYPQTVADNVIGLDEKILEAVLPKQDKSNLVTELSAESTDTQYPSAKLVYDELQTKQDNLTALTIDDIDFLWSGGYTITSTITNGIAQGANKILFTDVPITIIPNSGYIMPESVIVTNADYTYDENIGLVTLSNAIGNVTITAVCEAFPVDLDSMSWSDIKAISNVGQGANYFAVGDCKAVTLNGTVGTLALNNVTGYVYIIGFDHNSTVEGTGISFGTFFTALENGVSVALCDSHYKRYSTDGSKWFNMNHSANTNTGGWQGCDLRYDILGSVEAKNQQNATSVATSSPVANTLMAALPSDLRAVMKPITKYTDNVAGGSSSASNVTATVDYLPLMAEYEVFGTRRYANSAEQSHQAQYAYYVGSSASFRIKYNHSNTSSAVIWWERSAYSNNSGDFCAVGIGGHAGSYYAQSSCGVAPAFLV